MNKIISFFMAVVSFISALFSGLTSRTYFRNDYEVPESVLPYSRIDTAPKTDWTADYIWDSSDGSEENVWMCFRKTVEISKTPETLTAFISADSKYWLYINGETVVFEGSVKRGPTENDSYYDSVEIAPYLKPGRNVICALVWYWGKDKSYSYTDSGKAGFIFEAGGIVSDKSWKVCRNTAYQKDNFISKPNYRLPESNIYYDARKEIGDWLSADFDDSSWDYASEIGKGGSAPWGKLYPRGIPLLKDYGLKDYENSADYKNLKVKIKNKITLDIPYNAQCTPYLKIKAKAGKKIRIFTENTWLGAVSDTYITKDGVQEFEALGWFNGEHITYDIPSGVEILDLKYRETGYNTEFSGLFECDDENLNTLWQKSLRTLYVTMRDNFMDCPDRERAQWWGDVTNEMAMSMYALDTNSYLLYQKGAASMLGHIDGNTNIMQTVVPIDGEMFELQDKLFFTMGGAESHDKEFRTLGSSIWTQELPSDEEYVHAVETLEKYGWRTDFVITHCAPTPIQAEIAGILGLEGEYPANRLTDFLQQIHERLDFQGWFHGHYHTDLTSSIDPRVNLLFNNILQLV